MSVVQHQARELTVLQAHASPMHHCNHHFYLTVLAGSSQIKSSEIFGFTDFSHLGVEAGWFYLLACVVPGLQLSEVSGLRGSDCRRCACVQLSMFPSSRVLWVPEC